VFGIILPAASVAPRTATAYHYVLKLVPTEAKRRYVARRLAELQDEWPGNRQSMPIVIGRAAQIMR
jgi:hypothetical protein